MKIDEKIDTHKAKLETTLDSKFNELEAKNDALDKKIDTISKSLKVQIEA